MTYHLGVDLGTTFTAAAVARDGRAESVTLGTSSVAVPSVIYMGANELVVGQPAVRRAASEPSRVAREFKRRVGDPTPLVLGGSPIPAEMLMARLLAWVVDQVATTEGRPPASLAVTHPANWGEYKLDLLRQAIRHVSLQADHLVPEPVAAASFYASQRELAPGSIVAVYDLGGGTFDAALVRSQATGFEIVGRPDGVERLGGIDFDHVVLAHVAEAVGIDLTEVDDVDPGMAAALGQLRQECVEAKEALSSETDVSIPVMLPNRHTEVRLTRAEFESMIRPALDETVVALRRAISSAEVAPEQVASVLLVGGSSRIPLVSQRVMAELGRPIAVDARPKDAIPLGAALAAAKAASAPSPQGHQAPLQPVPLGMPPAPAPTQTQTPAQMAAHTPTGPAVPPTQPMVTPGAGSPVPGGMGLPHQAPPSAGSKAGWWIIAAVAAVGILVLGILLVNRDSGGGSGQLASSSGTQTTTTQSDSNGVLDLETTTTTQGENPFGGDLSDLLDMDALAADWKPGNPLPGDSWGPQARSQFVAECKVIPNIDTVAALVGQTTDDYCGCIYEDVSSSIDFDVYNDGNTSEEFPGEDHPVIESLTTAMFVTCLS